MQADGIIDMCDLHIVRLNAIRITVRLIEFGLKAASVHIRLWCACRRSLALSRDPSR